MRLRRFILPPGDTAHSFNPAGIRVAEPTARARRPMRRGRPLWPEQEDRLFREEMTTAVRSAMARLVCVSERDGLIVAVRYGIDPAAIGCDLGLGWERVTVGRPMTLKAIGRLVGLSKERVRQIELERLRDLRWMLEESGAPRFEARLRARRFAAVESTIGRKPL